jgi:diguanylate cyclase (GGDEF)-like protein
MSAIKRHKKSHIQPVTSASDEFQTQVLSLLCRRVLTLEKAEETLVMLQKKFPLAEVHRHFFHLLTNLTFSESVAEKHWKGLRDYHHSIQKRLHISLDLRVSTLGYFLLVCKKLRSPKFIELKLYMRNQSQLLKDELTGLYNFRHFKEILPREIVRCQSRQSELSLAILDIDNFKQVNDKYGHLVGDDVLIKSAEIVRKTVGARGLVFRYGGEELAILFPDVDKKSAFDIVDEARKNVAEFLFDSIQHKPFHVTFSAGVASCPQDGMTPKILIQMADEAGYFSKGNGKNQVSLYSKNYRKRQRVFVNLEAGIATFDSKMMPVLVTNISLQGAQIRSNWWYEINSFLKISFGDVEVVGKVVNVVSQGKSAMLGIRFAELTKEQELKLKNLMTTLPSKVAA